MNEPLRIALVVALGIVALVALFSVVAALFPRRVGRTRLVADAMPGRAVAVGLVNLVFFGAIGLAFVALSQRTRVDLLGLPALVIAGVLIITVGFGLTGVVQLVGDRLLPEAAAARRNVWGALALCLGCAVPYLGWFVLLPYVSLLGLGAFIISFVYRERPPDLPPTPPAS